MNRSAPTTRHPGPHPLAGQTVVLAAHVRDPERDIVIAGALIKIEDWVDRLEEQDTPGSSGTPMWERGPSNWAIRHYMLRTMGTNPALSVCPEQDDVIYGHIGSIGHCVHDSELAP